jgi:hypothetical protein
VFEDVAEAWKKYLSVQAPTWGTTDLRHGLSAEVRERLEQLDLILGKLRDAIVAVQGDPQESQRYMEEALHDMQLLRAGAIDGDDFDRRRIAASPPGGPEYVRQWQEVHLYTEMFYFVAWRLVQVLRRGGDFEFPHLHKIGATSVSLVRNQLLEHPEHAGTGGHFEQHLVVTDDGPVLKTNAAVFRIGTGRMEPSQESKDKSLFTRGG